MDENRLIELLTRRLAGEATTCELSELNKLIARYPEASATAILFEQIWNSKRSEEDVDEFYKRHIKKHCSEFTDIDAAETAGNLTQPTAKRNNVLIGIICIAAILVSAILVIIQQRLNKRPSSSYTQIVSGKGVRKSFSLPDGTKVFLNADSRISFDANMKTAYTRNVELSGEAFFDVAHIRDRPFVVHTGKFSIRVLGTSFNVKDYPRDKKCETTLIRGIIELSTNSASRQQFTLRPSEKFSVIETKVVRGVTGEHHDSATLLIENVAPVRLANKVYVPETSWTENNLIFENESLEDLAPQLERWFDVKIELGENIPPTYRYTGAFTNENIEEALNAMRLIKPFNFKIHDRNVVIY